jgi:hypothetical protein
LRVLSGDDVLPSSEYEVGLQPMLHSPIFALSLHF